MTMNGFNGKRTERGHGFFIPVLVLCWFVISLAPPISSVADNVPLDGPETSREPGDVFDVMFTEPGWELAYNMTLQLEKDILSLEGGLEGFLSDPVPGHKVHTFDPNMTTHELYWGTGNDATVPGTPSNYMDNSSNWMDHTNISSSDNIYMKNDFFMDNTSPDEAFPYHHFAFDVDIPSQNSDQRTLRELIFTWEGYGLESTVDAPYSAMIYIWNPADGDWYELDEIDNADNSADIIVTSIVNESPGSYLVNDSMAHFLVIGPIFNGSLGTTLTLATDFVELNVTWEDFSYPSDVQMDIGNDGVIDWSMSGSLTGQTSVLGDNVMLGSIQALIDDAGPGPGIMDVPVYVYSSTVGGLWVNELEVTYADPGEPSFLPFPDHGFSFDEDTLADDLIDLWEYTEDDYGVENLTFWIGVLEDTPQVEVELDDDGHHLDLHAQKDWFGRFHFTVRAVNRFNESTLSPNITVNVLPVNDPPVLGYLFNETAYEWQNFVYSVEATDVDHDDLIFRDDTDLFDIDPYTGIINFTPDEDDDGIHMINITVSDGKANDTGWFLLFIEEVDDGPIFDGFPSLVTVREDMVTIVNVSARDPERDEVTYAISPNTYRIDPSTGAITFDPTRPTTKDMPFTVTASANGLTSTLVFELRVEPVNDRPEIISMSATTADYGERLIEDVDVFFTAEVYDEDDGDRLTYIWTTDDETLSHELSFKKKLRAGEYNITFSVSDSDETVTRTTSLTVHAVQPPPPPPPPPPTTDPKPVISQPEAAAAVTTVAVVSVAAAVVIGTEVGKFGLFFFFAPLFSRIKKEKALDSFTRGKIYGAILMEPGISYNVLKEMTSVGNGNLAYHLKVLERTGYVVIRRDGLFKRFYPREAKIPKSHKVLSKIQKVILSTMVDEPGMTQSEVAEAIEVRRQVANYHIKKLVNMNLVSLEKVGNVKRCYPNEVEIKTANIDLGFNDFDVLDGRPLGEEV